MASDQLDCGVTTTAAHEVLQGNFSLQHDVAHCQRQLQACQAVTPLDSIPAEMTLSEFRGKMVKWRETATTSPSGRHLGCYKALFATALYNEATNPQDYHAFQEKQTSIIQLLMSLVNYAIRN